MLSPHWFNPVCYYMHYAWWSMHMQEHTGLPVLLSHACMCRCAALPVDAMCQCACVGVPPSRTALKGMPPHKGRNSPSMIVGDSHVPSQREGQSLHGCKVMVMILFTKTDRKLLTCYVCLLGFSCWTVSSRSLMFLSQSAGHGCKGQPSKGCPEYMGRSKATFVTNR